jgi:hypothetical protein
MTRTGFVWLVPLAFALTSTIATANNTTYTNQQGCLAIDSPTQNYFSSSNPSPYKVEIERICNFIATTSGGLRYAGNGTWKVSIVRSQRTITYSGSGGPSCKTSVVSSGDWVHMELKGGALAAGDLVSLC